MEHIPVCVVSNIKHAIDAMKKAGINIIGAEAGKHHPPWEVDLLGPAALVVGSEDKGVRRVVREKCDMIVSLPIRGRVTSLNTSVAAGILMYEYLRQNSGR
jgi:23S rRNA (guanosine2251-2'-O)-methyltransferase